MPDDRGDSAGAVPADDWAGRCLSTIASLTGDLQAPPQDRRASGRAPVAGSALIRLEFGHPIACTLVDRSDRGARLKVLSVLGIPDAFILSIGPERMRARVAWRSPSEIGVALSPV